MLAAQKYQDELPRLKKMVEQSREYMSDNIKLFLDFRRAIFKSSLTNDDIQKLQKRQMPQLEFNILEAYISRLLGEWSKQEPSIVVNPAEGRSVNTQDIELVEGNFKVATQDANSDGCQYELMKDFYSGGFTALKIWTEYANERSFDQVIRFGRVFDPTLCGFDPLARTPHKGDGRYVYELYPKTKDELLAEYKDLKMDGIKFTRKIEGFNWSYKSGREEIALVCDFYEKKSKKVKLIQLADGFTGTNDEVQSYLNQWVEQNPLGQPPIVKWDRMTKIDYICRYRFIDNCVLEYVETDYKYLPIIFGAGNPIDIRESENGATVWMTRPYVYHAMGMQRLKNFAGQSLANELENTIQHKFKAALEGIPDDYQDGYTNPQNYPVLIYHALLDNDPSKPLPPPQEIARVPMPPEISSTFMAADQTIQGILGSYDASLGINNNQLSGVAIVEGATQSNAAAMPFVVGFMQMWTRLAECYVDLLPKYIVGNRTLPVMGKDGKRQYKQVNGLNYRSEDLNIRVEAGVNFAIQKSRALQEMTAMSQANPKFAEFMGWSKVLPFILDNMEMRNIDQLKDLADEWLAIEQQQQNQPPPPNPMMMAAQAKLMDAQTKQAELSHKQNELQSENQFRAIDLNIRSQEAETGRMQTIGELAQAHQDSAVEIAKTQTERLRTAADLALKSKDQMHRHVKESVQLQHTINQKNNDQLDNSAKI
jgi:hypothetical protein